MSGVCRSNTRAQDELIATGGLFGCGARKPKTPVLYRNSLSCKTLHSTRYSMRCVLHATRGAHLHCLLSSLLELCAAP